MTKLFSSVMAFMVAGVVSTCFADTYGDGKRALENGIYCEAATQFVKACDSGNAQGCFHLAALYEKGEGVVQNKYKAAALYTQACNGGEAHGCSNMCLMYDTP